MKVRSSKGNEHSLQTGCGRPDCAGECRRAPLPDFRWPYRRETGVPLDPPDGDEPTATRSRFTWASRPATASVGRDGSLPTHQCHSRPCPRRPEAAGRTRTQAAAAMGTHRRSARRAIEASRTAEALRAHHFESPHVPSVGSLSGRRMALRSSRPSSPRKRLRPVVAQAARQVAAPRAAMALLDAINAIDALASLV